jgi:hypothetical protein
MAVSHDLLLAILGGDLTLEAPALELGLRHICLQLRLGVLLPSVGVTALRVRISVNLRLLQATFTRQIVIADERAGGLFRLAGDPAR